ncbi:MAG TPA: hypothetical protein VL122_08995 [Nitrospirota bacterium]|nr:hypothetical protein [Nitrospirota bacterium]
MRKLSREERNKKEKEVKEKLSQLLRKAGKSEVDMGHQIEKKVKEHGHFPITDAKCDLSYLSEEEREFFTLMLALKLIDKYTLPYCND